MQTNSFFAARHRAVDFAHCFGMLWLFAVMPAAVAADNVEFARAFTLGDVDLDQSSVTTAGQRLPLDASMFKACFQPVLGEPVKGEVLPDAHSDSVPRGQVWFNTSKDPRPGAPQQLQRGPVSTALPSWYLLSWMTSAFPVWQVCWSYQSIK